MRILFDHCVPRPLKRFLPEHEIATTFERGWAAYKNGELLDAVQAEFDVFLTTDQNLPYQQDVAVRSITLVVLVADSNRVGHPDAVAAVSYARFEQQSPRFAPRPHGKMRTHRPTRKSVRARPRTTGPRA